MLSRAGGMRKVQPSTNSCSRSVIWKEEITVGNRVSGEEEVVGVVGIAESARSEDGFFSALFVGASSTYGL